MSTRSTALALGWGLSALALIACGGGSHGSTGTAGAGGATGGRGGSGTAGAAGGVAGSGGANLDGGTAGTDGGAGTGGGADARPDASQPPPAPRIEILPAGLLLGPGQSGTMTARVLDASGMPVVGAAVVWSTSSSAVTLSPTDSVVTVTAGTAAGSAQISARMGSLESPPVTVAIARPVAGARVVRDDEVLGDTTPVGNSPLGGPGARVHVIIAGAAPATGQILVGTGKPVAGKVISSAPVTGGNDVTLEILPLDQIFAELQISESYDSNKLAIGFPSGAPSSVTVNADGSTTRRFVLDLPGHTPSPKPAPPEDTLEWGPLASKSFRLGAMYCGVEATLEPSISASQITTSVTPHLGPVLLNLGVAPAGAFMKVVADGSIDAVVSGPFRLNGELEGTIGCQAPVLQLFAPVPPPIALIAWPALVIGPRFSAAGKITVNLLELVIDAQAKQPFRLGFEVPAGGAFTNLSQLDTSALQFKLDPKLRNTTPSSPLRVQVDARGGLYAEAALTSIPYLALQNLKGDYPFLSMLDLESGLSAQLRLGTAADQVNDPAYAAGYDINFLVQIGLGSDLKKAFGWVSNLAMLVPVDPQLKYEKTVFSSPTGRLLTYLQKFQAGERVGLRGLLDAENAAPALLDYYNVKAIEVWRKNGPGGAVKVARRDVVKDELDASFDWLATYAGTSKDDWQAFIEPTFGEGFLFKISPAHGWGGITQIGAGNDEIGRALATDVDGRVIVVGYWLDTFTGKPFFGGADAGWIEFSAAGASSNGTLSGTAGDDVPSDVAVGPDQFYYVAGTTLGTAFIGAQTFSAWLRKINRSGQVIWTREWITPGYGMQRAGKLAIGPNGEIYVGSSASALGMVAGSAVSSSCGLDYVLNFDMPDCGDVVVSAFDRNGTPLWTRVDVRKGYQGPPAVAADPSGNIAVAATTWGDIEMDLVPGNKDSTKQLGAADYAKTGVGIWTLDSSGAIQSRTYLRIPEDTTFGKPPVNLNVQDIACDSLGNVTLLGNTEGALLGQPFAGGQDAFLVQYSMLGLGSGASENWAQLFGTTGQDLGIALRALPNDDLLVTGLTAGSLFAPSAGLADGYVMRLPSSGGTPLWQAQFGGPGNDIGTDVTLDLYGNTFVCGETDNRLADGLTAGYGGRDVFVAKFGPNGMKQ